MQELAQKNELGFKTEVKEETSLMAVQESRAVAEVQAAYVIAKKFPRNEMVAYSKIMDACKRPFLAEQSMYAYPKGNQTVTGPSIRLAEVLAQSWGNIEFGIREISQSNGVSTVEAYAIDLETNARKPVVFHVKHERHTKKGITRLTDPRDIYELVANMGARRMRACILAVLPGDVVEAAVEQCKKTMQSSDIPLSDQIKKMVVAFDELGVKVDHLEKRLGHKLDAVIPQEIVVLKSIYKSIKDGHAGREAFFDIAGEFSNQDAAGELDALLGDKSKNPKKEPVKDDQK